MFGKKPKQEPGNAPKRKGAELMNQMGFGMPTNMEDMEAMVYGDDDDDDLEAELAALTGGEASTKKSPTKKGPVHMMDIERMAAHNMQDVDEDVSDTEDPDLLAELADLEDDEPQPTPTPPPQRSPAPAPVPSPSNQQAPPTYSPTFSPTLPQTPARSPQPSPGPSPSQGSQGGDAATVVQDRITMYQQALQNAKQTGDSSKARRLDRGLKTLTDTLRKVKAGKPITEEDMPPPVAMGTSTSTAGPSTAAATPSPTHRPSSSVDRPAPSTYSPQPQPGPSQPGPSTSSAPESSTRHTLETRKEQYRHAALAAKRGGDMSTAAKYAKIAKQFDTVLHALDEGKPIDLSNMPPPLPGVPAAAAQTSRQPAPDVRVQRSTNVGTGGQGAQPEEPAELPPEPTEEEAKKLFHAPDAPKTVLEALTQRLEKYKSSESSAKEAGEGSKARRMGRIVKQYESAIKDYRAGKPVDFEELPTPPGFAPIPADSGPPPRASPSPQKPQQPPPSSSPAAAAAGSGARASMSPPQPAPRPQAPSPRSSAGAAAAAAGGAHAKAGISRAAPSRKSGHSRQEQQLAFLRERMEEFKTAALQAKKNKDLELAKQHIRMMKGIEPMIEALEAGLPVDLAQVPPSPLANEENEDKFVVVTAEDCQPTGDRDEVFTQLEQDLTKQIQICHTNALHFTKMGDVPGAAKFQKMGQGCSKDLESLKSSRRHGDPLPKFHYETRSFSIVQSNTELGENEMELTVVRGISYNPPSGYSEKDMDTMIKYELAYPSDEPQTGHTSTVKDTINPEYNETFKLQIDRKSRSFARFIERKGIKLDIYLKRGFFKGDKLLGSVTVKLTPLESKCTLHDSFDLMDGRKSVGGKLEVKVRVRDPFKGRQVEESKEKWLVIDQFIRTVGSKSQVGQASAPQKPKNEGTNCMEVLRYEKQQLDKQISYLKDSLSAIQMQTLRHKSSLLEEKLELQQKQLREGGTEAWKAYIAAVEKEAVLFETEARQLAKIGDVQKAETMINKCKLAKKELAAIKAKIEG